VEKPKIHFVGGQINLLEGSQLHVVCEVFVAISLQDLAETWLEPDISMEVCGQTHCQVLTQLNCKADTRTPGCGPKVEGSTSNKYRKSTHFSLR
jgi:hypothetical protein